MYSVVLWGVRATTITNRLIPPSTPTNPTNTNTHAPVVPYVLLDDAAAQLLRRARALAVDLHGPPEVPLPDAHRLVWLGMGGSGGLGDGA